MKAPAATSLNVRYPITRRFPGRDAEGGETVERTQRINQSALAAEKYSQAESAADKTGSGRKRRVVMEDSGEQVSSVICPSRWPGWGTRKTVVEEDGVGLESSGSEAGLRPSTGSGAAVAAAAQGLQGQRGGRYLRTGSVLKEVEGLLSP